MCLFTWKHLFLPSAPIMSPFIWRKGPSNKQKKKAGDDKMDNKRGASGSPLPLGPQIRPPALPLENRLRTQRKLLSAALPHLPGLSTSNSLVSTTLSPRLVLSLSPRLNTGISIRAPSGYRGAYSFIRPLRNVSLENFFFPFLASYGV